MGTGEHDAYMSVQNGTEWYGIVRNEKVYDWYILSTTRTLTLSWPNSSLELMSCSLALQFPQSRAGTLRRAKPIVT